ncbi:metal-dependent hydrolase [Dysgonomonas sp. Marseille-P4677]|uniref:metal-dependent hydrolase n=1 Tax=Dysgonomonas sp. Marseille-P4677 TaxID=2364790 RepID=UPI0019126357|nr:metal-dependent hydrolase [Dysgonomonas sp. Marseille-P4677]MBK5722545.1 metal-dependent hydrolase [Dysgonomonas sp. Marseille-P4677]
MDILTHALSGMAVATCAVTFTKGKALRKAKVIFTGALGGLLPDIDAVSMWSRFDSTFGALFNLSDTGRVIYGSKFWYSHHAFFHSLLASVLIGALIILLVYMFRHISSKKKLSFSSFIQNHFIYFVVFVLGYWAHLAGDLPTPSSVWGGIAFLWPSDDYIGGSGNIWWWNNYDIFLLIFCCIVINLIMPTISKRIRANKKVFTSVVLFVTLVLILVQVNTRQYDYAYKGNTTKYAEMEQNSKKEQERILGKKLYRLMDRFDRSMKFHF